MGREVHKTPNMEKSGGRLEKKGGAKAKMKAGYFKQKGNSRRKMRK